MSRATDSKWVLIAFACLAGPLAAGGGPAPVTADEPATPPAKKPADAAKKPRTLGVVLYPKFETLDAFGPVEVFGNLGPRVKVVLVAAEAGPVASVQGPKAVAEYGFDNCPRLDLILVPGGIGTVQALKDQRLHDWLRARAAKAEIVMSVCTGSAILAKAGLLDGRRATSNKQYYSFACAQGPKVQWVKEARWVDDGNRVTSSGVSAGIDMALHVVARLFGEDVAQKVADGTEYQWHKDAAVDPFAKFAK